MLDATLMRLEVIGCEKEISALPEMGVRNRANFLSTDLIHLIGIAAPAETIYRAITTEEGIRAWWTTAVDFIGGASVHASRFSDVFLPARQ